MALRSIRVITSRNRLPVTTTFRTDTSSSARAVSVVHKKTSCCRAPTTSILCCSKSFPKQQKRSSLVRLQLLYQTSAKILQKTSDVRWLQRSGNEWSARNSNKRRNRQL